MSLPSPPRCILNRGHSVHPCFCCFFNLELKTSVHQTLGSISLWSSAHSNHFRACCARVCFSGRVVRAQMNNKKRKPKPNIPKNQQKPSTPGVEVLGKHWYAHLQIYSSSRRESKRMKARICLKPLASGASDAGKKLDSLCAGSALPFLDFWCSTVACPDILVSAHSFCVEQSGSWFILVLWLLQCSINFSEVRIRTRARSIRSFRWIEWLLLKSSASVSGLHQLWESPDLNVLPWLFSFLRCIKFQLCTGQYLLSVDVSLPASGNLVVSWYEIFSKLSQGSG